jgi:hypothetical protein
LPKTEAPQPDQNVHNGAYTIGVAHIICRGSEGVQGGVGVLGVSQAAGSLMTLADVGYQEATCCPIVRVRA